MHDIKFIRKNPEKFQKQMNRRGLNIDISSILEIDEAIRKKQAEIQVLQEKRNNSSKENLGFVPHSLINLFSFSLSPSGTSSSKLFGNTFKISFSSLEYFFIS